MNIKQLLLKQSYCENTEGLWIWTGLNLFFLVDQTGARATRKWEREKDHTQKLATFFTVDRRLIRAFRIPSQRNGKVNF